MSLLSQYPPPLPPYSPRARTVFPSTRLLDLAKLTDLETERLYPFQTPPWHRTIFDDDVRDRVKVVASKEETKDDAKKRHLNEISEYEMDEDHLLIYTDGSQVKAANGTQKTGLGIVAYKERQSLWESCRGLGNRGKYTTRRWKHSNERPSSSSRTSHATTRSGDSDLNTFISSPATSPQSSA